MPPRREYPTLGGRRLKPAFDPISEDPPTADDVRWSDKLWNYMQEASPQETLAEQQKRSTVMAEITSMFKEWVTSVCLSKGVPSELATSAGGQVLTSGSYRLGINERGMDIDTICVAPQPVTREDFFGSLQAILEDHDSVENLSSIPGAAVPIITFDYNGINIDLLFASLPLDAVPEDFDVNFDDVLRGVDQGTEKSLNGPRVTEMLTQLVPNYDSFLAVVRCIRLWAKKRGLYSNKMGFFGGINCNLLVCFVCQLYPQAAAARLLERFFFILKDWKFPTPIMLTPPYDAALGLEVWDPQVGGNRFHVMPILTPAYPSMNSSMSATSSTLKKIQEEMALAHETVKATLEQDGEGWGRLFAEPNFVVAHSKYLGIEIYVKGLEPHRHPRVLQSWQGLVESRLRKLTDVPYLGTLPLATIRLMPKKQPLLTVADAQNGQGQSWLVGYDVDRERLQGNELHLTAKVDAFRDECIRTASWQEMEGMDEASVWRHLKIKFSPFASWKELPDASLAPVGGRAAAKVLRKQLVAQRAAAAIAAGNAEAGAPGTPATPGTPGTPSAAAAAAATPPPPPSAAPSRDPRRTGQAAADPRLAAGDPRLRGSDPRLAAARATATATDGLYDGLVAGGGAEAGAEAGTEAGAALGGAAVTPKRTAAAAGLEGGGESEVKMQRTPSLLPDMSGDGASDSPETHRAAPSGSSAPPGRGKIKLTLASG